MNDVLYIPFNKENKPLYERRKKILGQFIENGWKLTANLPITDAFRNETNVWIIERPI